MLLKTADDNTFLPIWIGHPEAAAILMKLQGGEPDRPMTHDLLSTVIASLAGEVVAITVTELRENTYHARITLAQDGREIEVDSRTSDAIALALRTDAKIYAVEAVVDESGIEFDGEESIERHGRARPSRPLADLDPAEFSRFLDTVTPDEFAAEVGTEPRTEEDEEPCKEAPCATERLAGESSARISSEDGVDDSTRRRGGERAFSSSRPGPRAATRSRSGSESGRPRSSLICHSSRTSTSLALTAAEDLLVGST